MSIQSIVRKWDGKPISEPGIYADVPMSTVYHQQCCVGPSVSSSNIRAGEARNMEHAYAEWSGNPDREPEEDTSYFGFGRLVHELGGGVPQEEIEKVFVVRPDKWDSWRTKDAKAWRAEQQALGRTCMTPQEYEAAYAVIRKLQRHPTIQAGILNGLVEHSIFWQDPITGLWCKARPDVIPVDSGMVVDLKTTTDASLPMCINSISKFGYHIQMAMIQEGLTQLGFPMEEFVLLFVESAAPYSINHKPLESYALEYGARQLRRGLNRWAQAIETNEWPGYEDDEVAIGLSEGLRKRLTAEAENGTLPKLSDYDPNAVL